MGKIIDYFIYSVIFVFFCYVLIQSVMMHLQINHAYDFFNYVEDTMELNNFDPTVLENLKSEASQCGYVLTYTDESSKYPSVSHCYWINLKYNVTMSILNVGFSRTKGGYVKSLD